MLTSLGSDDDEFLVMKVKGELQQWLPMLSIGGGVIRDFFVCVQSSKYQSQ
jgi:hypothetical protein